jgi:hypothetical protein
MLSPDGYGNMSMTNAGGRIATRSKPSERGPVGFGAWKVPARAQRCCHAVSISSAIVPV